MLNLKLGERDGSRWLVEWNAIGWLYVCHHREVLGQTDTENLRMLVEYIFGVAYQTWFYIKVRFPTATNF